MNATLKQSEQAIYEMHKKIIVKTKTPTSKIGKGSVLNEIEKTTKLEENAKNLEKEKKNGELNLKEEEIQTQTNEKEVEEIKISQNTLTNFGESVSLEQSQVFVEKKEIFDEKKNLKAQNGIIKSKNLSVIMEKDQSANDRHRKIVEQLKNASFNFDTYYLPVCKIKPEIQLKIDYTKVRLNDFLCAGGNVWIIKVAGMNRGFGVEVFQTLEELKKLIKDIGTGYQERIVQDNKQISRSSVYIKTAKFVIQKYIERPLLYKNRKMDLRVWVMFSHENKPYIFRECYVRLSAAVFDMAKINEKFVHLTNNALQKYCEQYDEDETLKSTQDLEAFVKESVRPDYSFKRDTWTKIRRLVKIVHNCCTKGINVNNKKLSFEIFGFDFMIDESFGVWLIETNTNPSITTPGIILKAYVPRMINDAFKLTVDRVFPSKDPQILEEQVIREEKQNVETFPMPGYPDDENLWDFLDEKI